MVGDWVVTSTATCAIVEESKDVVDVLLKGPKLASVQVYSKEALAEHPVRLPSTEGLLYERTEKPERVPPGGHVTGALNICAGKTSPLMQEDREVVTPVVTERRARQTKLIMYMWLVPSELVSGEVSVAAVHRSSFHERRPCARGQATGMSYRSLRVVMLLQPVVSRITSAPSGINGGEGGGAAGGGGERLESTKPFETVGPLL